MGSARSWPLGLAFFVLASLETGRARAEDAPIAVPSAPAEAQQPPQPPAAEPPPVVPAPLQASEATPGPPAAVAPPPPSTPVDAPPSTPVDVAPAPAPPAVTGLSTLAPAAPPAPPPSKPPPNLAEASRRGPHADRVVLMPTAETQPKGTYTFSSYDVILLQGTYAFSDSTQVTFTFTPPIEGFFPSDLSVKSTIAQGRSYRLAALGSVALVTGLEDGPGWLGRAGLVGQGCLDARCRSSVNLGVNVILAGPASFYATGLGFVARVSEGVTLLMELDSLVPSGDLVGEYHGVAASGGVRWAGTRWAVDAALSASLTGGGALPLVVGTYRILD